MAGPPPLLIRFDPTATDPGPLGEVIDHLAAMTAERAGWANLEPEVPDPERLPRGALGGGIFSNRGPAVPLCTWTAPSLDRKGTLGPQSIGVQHAIGSRARPHLATVGLEIPEGWVVRADHPKRGLVVELAPGIPPATVLDWLLAAGEALATVPLTGWWHATVHRR